MSGASGSPERPTPAPREGMARLLFEDIIEEDGVDFDYFDPMMLSPDDSAAEPREIELSPADAGPRSPPPSSGQTNGNPKKKNFQLSMTSKIRIIPNNRQGHINSAFLSTIPGVLKLAEILIAFIAFILAICADRRSTTAAWTEHITFETMIIVSALLLGYVVFPHLTIRDEATREGLIVVELLFYGINTLFYFIAIWLMVHLSASWGTDGRGAAIMAAILCVALTVLFAVETFLKLREWRGENESSGTVIETTKDIA